MERVCRIRGIYVLFMEDIGEEFAMYKIVLYPEQYKGHVDGMQIWYAVLFLSFEYICFASHLQGGLLTSHILHYFVSLYSVKRSALKLE
jgi:hypothetical protein